MAAERLAILREVENVEFRRAQLVAQSAFAQSVIGLVAAVGFTLAIIGTVSSASGSYGLFGALSLVFALDPLRLASWTAVVGFGLLAAAAAAFFQQTLVKRNRREALDAERFHLDGLLKDLDQQEVDERRLLVRAVDQAPRDSDAVAVSAPQIPTPAPFVPEPPEELIRACAAQDVVLYTGLGIGAQAGLPTWPTVLAEIIRQADAQQMWIPIAPVTSTTLDPQQFSLALQNTLESGDLSGLPDLIIGRLDRARLLSILQEIYSTATLPLPGVCDALRTIQFASVLSASWDDLLERTFGARLTKSELDGDTPVLSVRASADFADRFRQKLFTIIKLFGTLSRPGDYLFTADEYGRALQENPDVTRFMSSLSTSRTLFFVGSSLNNIASFLGGLGVSPPTNKQHFALVPWQRDIAVQQERFAARWGVELLVFEPSQDYAEVRQFCDALAHGVAARVPTHPPPAQRPSTLSAATLDRVVLSNIGPFEGLSLDFHAGWNVLLGNNSSGKSTVLRAIALALCGRDDRAAALAGPLLRAHADVTSGFIELTVGDRIYHTDLDRSGGTVRVRSQQLTPAEEGLWAVVAFPPLRGASARNPRGALDESEPPYPVLDDILPLLAGSIDFRLDDVKQWVVNALVRRADGDPNAPIPMERNRQLIDTFFRLIARLTPGLRTEFVEVTSSYQVMVKTDDGIVPIGQLSQGLSSMVGWIGTLLRRMYAIYPLSDRPEAEPALVLVDEVDAHLHPEWQRHLAPALQAVFPRVQIIATTHSPLLLPSLERRQITLLRRDSSTGLIGAPVTSYDVQEYSPDQVLSSPLFGLPSILSPVRERQVGQFTKLTAKQARAETLTESEQAELATLSFELDIRPPSPQAQAAARLAYQIIQEGFERHAADLPAEQRARVDDEIRNQLQEIITGTRRPG